MESNDLSALTAADFQQFIADGATRLTPRAIHDLVAELPDIRGRFPEIAAAGFPLAERQLSLLADVVEGFAFDRDRDLPYHVALESAFALSYFHRDVDLIPDTLGALGFTDDAAVIEIVIARNAEPLRSFAKEHGHHWADVAPAAGDA